MIDRRAFLKGMAATAAGVLVPGSSVAEPDRRIWALDRTMISPASTWVRVHYETDPMKWFYYVNLRYDDGFTDSVPVSAEALHRGATIQAPRGGVLSAVDITQSWTSTSPVLLRVA